MGMDILVISSSRSAYDLGLSCLEKSLVESGKCWLLVAAVEPWLAGEGEGVSSTQWDLEEGLGMTRSGTPTSMGWEEGQGRAHKTSFAETLINSHDKMALFSLNQQRSILRISASLCCGVMCCCCSPRRPTCLPWLPVYTQDKGNEQSPPLSGQTLEGRRREKNAYATENMGFHDSLL